MIWRGVRAWRRMAWVRKRPAMSLKMERVVMRVGVCEGGAPHGIGVPPYWRRRKSRGLRFLLLLLILILIPIPGGS